MINLKFLVTTIEQQVINIKKIACQIEELVSFQHEQNNKQNILEKEQQQNNLNLNSKISIDKIVEEIEIRKPIDEILVKKEKIQVNNINPQKVKNKIISNINCKQNENEYIKNKESLTKNFNKNNEQIIQNKSKDYKDKLTNKNDKSMNYKIEYTPKEFLESLNDLNFDPTKIPYVSYVKNKIHNYQIFAKRIGSCRINKCIPRNFLEFTEINTQILKHIYSKYAYALDLDEKLLNEIYLRLKIN